MLNAVAVPLSSIDSFSDLYIGYSRNEFLIDLDAMQIGACTQVLIMVVQQQGSIVNGRESYGRNASISYVAAIGSTREDADTSLQASATIKKKINVSKGFRQFVVHLQFIQGLLEGQPIRIGCICLCWLHIGILHFEHQLNAATGFFAPLPDLLLERLQVLCHSDSNIERDLQQRRHHIVLHTSMRLGQIDGGNITNVEIRILFE